MHCIAWSRTTCNSGRYAVGHVCRECRSSQIIRLAQRPPTFPTTHQPQPSHQLHGLPPSLPLGLAPPSHQPHRPTTPPSKQRRRPPSRPAHQLARPPANTQHPPRHRRLRRHRLRPVALLLPWYYTLSQAVYYQVLHSSIVHLTRAWLCLS